MELLYQSIPAVAVTLVLVANLLRKRRWCCISSIVLLYTTLAFWGALVMVSNPRNGVTYVNLDAMIFLAVAYVILCVPPLFFKDGVSNKSVENMCGDRNFNILSVVLIFLTVPAAIYFLVRALPSLVAFLHGNVSREQFRVTIDISRTSSLFVSLFNVGAVFSYCATFAAAYGLAFRKICMWKIMLLFFGGAAHTISTLENVARSGLMEYAFLLLAIFGGFWPRMLMDMKRNVRRFFYLFALVLSLPFLSLTAVRFCGAGGEGESMFYTLFSYFSTGPYSFNADYTVRTESELPSTEGVLTCPYLPLLMDKINSTSRYLEISDELDERLHKNTPEYVELCNGYAGEFKTIVGTLLLDYPPIIVLTVVIVVSLVFVLMFVKSREKPADFIVASIYFFMLFMGPIGYAFATRYRTTMLMAFILFAFVLSCDKSSDVLKEGES